MALAGRIELILHVHKKEKNIIAEQFALRFVACCFSRTSPGEFMWKLLCFVCFVTLISSAAFCQSYGLSFNSHEAVPEKRTSLQLDNNDSLHFKNGFRLDFDFNFLPSYKTYFGYLVRIISANQNIDLIYDQRSSFFRVITGQQFSGISFKLDASHLFHDWNHVSLSFDPQKKQLQLAVNNKPIGVAGLTLQDQYFRFLWGANDDQRFQTRDIPPMRVREIKLFDGDKLQYHWCLNETSGNNSSDNIHQQTAIVKNAVWIKPRHQKWNLVSSFTVKGNAVTAFDSKDEKVIISGSDSIVAYDVKNVQQPWSKVQAQRGSIMPGVQAIYDTLSGSLYDISTNQKKLGSYRFGKAQWSNLVDTIMNEFGHANKFISPYDSSLYIIGGYGQLKYKNMVQRYSFATKQWDTVQTKGDVLPPRYLAALGLNSAGDTAYIVGGYGSRSGDQMLDPGNYYDVYAFDVKSKSFTKLLDFDNHQQKFTFANSLVIDSKRQQYYGLIFPNDSFNSNLRLVQGSLKDSSYRLLGSEIPFSFYDVQSFADLYYAPDAGKLIAVTLLYASSDNAPSKYTTVKIYSIDFPPAGAEPVESTLGTTPGNGNRLYIFLLLGLVALAGFLIFFLKRKRTGKEANEPDIVPANRDIKIEELTPQAGSLSPEPNEERIPEGATAQLETIAEADTVVSKSRVLLFGQFQVLDKEGLDITSLFTPLIKELFLLIVIYTFRTGRGITSEELNEILWNGKSVKDAKNNRSVNLAKLKNILERLGNCIVVKKAGFWQLQVIEESVFIDYEKFVFLTEQSDGSKKHIEELLKVIQKGSFLLQTEYSWLDDVKAEISNLVIDDCLKYLSQNDDCFDDPEFVIEIANNIFHFDSLNEYALEFKCKSLILLKRHTLANKTYARFMKDYKDIYGEEFSKSFHEVIKSDSAGSLQV